MVFATASRRNSFGDRRCFDGSPEFRAAMADPFTHSTFGHFDADGGAFTRGQRYPCGTVPSSFSRVGPLRLKQAGARPRSLLEQMTASARLAWRRATQRFNTELNRPPSMQMGGWIGEQPASMATRQGPELNSRIYEQPSGSAGEQCWTEIFRLPGELRRGPGVRRCRRTPRHRRGEPARHPSRSRRRCAPDRSSINPAPDPVFADIENFRPRDRLRARDRSSLDSPLEGDGFEPLGPP